MGLKEKLEKCLYKAFALKAGDYIDFSLVITNKYSNKFGGEYIPSEKLLIIQSDESNCYELMFSTAIHELSHHVEYSRYGYTKHDSRFHEIQSELIVAAFKLKYIHPSKLKLAESFLSRHSERKRIVSICDEYIAKNKINQYQLEVTYFLEKKDKGFTYSPVLDGYYKFEIYGKKNNYLTKEG